MPSASAPSGSGSETAPPSGATSRSCCGSSGDVIRRVCDLGREPASSVLERRSGLVPGVAGGALPLLHPRLEHVPVAVGEGGAGALVEGPERRPVVRVEVLDDLEGPPVGDDVAADEV